jgi:hypothetical protein
MNTIASWKSALLSLLILTGSSAALSQMIPNGGFELWATDPDSNLNPVYWETTNAYPLVNVEPVTPACVGSLAMRVKTINIGFPFPGVAILHTSFPFTQVPRRLSAYVRSTIMPGDTAFIIVALMRGDSVVASTDSCTFRIGSTISQCTYREFPIGVQSTLVPDSMIIIVASGLFSGQVGTELTVDEIAFHGTAGVSGDGTIPATVALHQNYPNPFNPATKIEFELPQRSAVRLTVVDLLGQEVEVLASGDFTAGSHRATWDASRYRSGVYFYRLQTESHSAVRKLILLK